MENRRVGEDRCSGRPAHSLFREDGQTYGTPTWIWSVVVNNEVYVRAYNGQSSSWYQAALEQKAGRIRSAGLVVDVIFDAIEGSIQDQIDSAYRQKYVSSPYLNAMLSSRARAATVRIVPN